jgi:hypothetical protein
MSAYAKLPSNDPENAPLAKAEKLAREGLRQAGRALEGPAGADVAALIADTNLPEVDGDDALGALSRRLDREADLWRNLAIRELAHVAWANRIVQAASIVTVVGVVALAGVAAFGALFGAAAAGRALLVGTAAGALALGTLAASWASASLRKSQREIVREALVRADVAELRLHRIALAMASLKADPDRARDTLARLEKDVTG